MTDSTEPAGAAAAAQQRRQKIALLGPVAPYRGGIAQYTTRLKQSLEKVADLQVLSFKRQYPKWLYPGESDKEPGGNPVPELGVSYTIDALSPLSWHRAASAVIAKGCDHAILNWWTLFWAPAFAYIAWRLRRHGIRTTFLCHNLFDHGAKGFRTALSKKLLSNADSYIVHSNEQFQALKATYPDKPVLQRLHPVYDHFPRALNVLPKRGQLEVLFFGFIRPYKGLDVLLDAMKLLTDQDLRLTIVGESWGDDAKIIEAAKASSKSIEAHLGYVDNQTAADYFERSDIVVLPYLSATGSGVAALAYHYCKPVLASRVGGLEDAVIDGTTGWLVAPGSTELLAAALAGIDRVGAAGLKKGIQTFVKDNDWDSMASAICGFGHVASPNHGRTQCH